LTYLRTPTRSSLVITFHHQTAVSVIVAFTTCADFKSMQT